ncbi:MAG: DUF2283 domain-containing protein [Planctomycetes bacterium]|nr:DUF2283 domain-containing protein [Planctomycetota bacterium]
MQGKAIGFEMSISARNDGTVEAVYILVRGNKVARTKEIIEDILLADYDSRGQLVGIEILAPVRIQRITPLVEQPRRRPFSKFVRERAPADLVLA